MSTAAVAKSHSEWSSGVVRPQQMPWDKARFPGCYIKTLLFEPKSGIATVIMKMDPGAVLPDHEHVLIEQTYVLSGSLVDKEGPDAGLEIKAGEYVWRPAGSRHSAWSPNGGEFLAMFQVPNKFFEQDGRVADASGNDWEDTWAHVLGK